MSEMSNVINSTDAKRWVGEILGSWKTTREIREEAKDKIRPDLEEQVEHRQELYQMAEAAGMPLAALKLEVARQKLDWENELRKKAKEAGAAEGALELADMIREALGDFAGLPLGEAAVVAGAAEAAGTAPKKGKAAPKAKANAKGSKNKVKLVGEDTGSAPKKGADDEPDLRSTRQREQEAARKAENEERLKGIKPLDGTAGVH